MSLVFDFTSFSARIQTARADEHTPAGEGSLRATGSMRRRDYLTGPVRGTLGRLRVVHANQFGVTYGHSPTRAFLAWPAVWHRSICRYSLRPCPICCKARDAYAPHCKAVARTVSQQGRQPADWPSCVGASLHNGTARQAHHCSLCL